jgi:hypothetical protein
MIEWWEETLRPWDFFSLQRVKKWHNAQSVVLVCETLTKPSSSEKIPRRSTMGVLSPSQIISLPGLFPSRFPVILPPETGLCALKLKMEMEIEMKTKMELRDLHLHLQPQLQRQLSCSLFPTPIVHLPSFI